ncbi:hypothetical protein CI105_08960 [Candidatus Izimaplasma bacterium ZiA1]|uniref:phosphotransferase n=1 Tax=Candidatus Izimoplasma sp. ZiA1 TaxID=2024899 RepID=UPI000BAA68FE|nr:hypothetical protein CI105_08960 [Candidatus Izimaplasma bacterium ZiA1]
MTLKLKTLVEDRYDFADITIDLHRDMIGSVYIIRHNDIKYVLKVYKETYLKEGLLSIGIISYLNENNGPVPKIIKTKSDKNYVTFNNKIMVIFEFIEGKEVILESHENEILESIQKIHKIMNNYKGNLIKRDFSFYVLRYIDILENKEFDPNKIKELKKYGHNFYNVVTHTTFKFCHGDLHTGNMIYNKNNEIIIYDFDAAGFFNPLTDYSTLYNVTDFNNFNTNDIDQTYNILNDMKKFTEKEILQMIAFIPLRHYELIATIISVKGEENISESFYDEQYKWIKDFYDYYISKRIS